MPTSIDYELQKTAKEVREALAIVFQKGTCKPDRFHNLRFMDGDELLKDNPYLRDILPHLPISEDPDYVYDVLPDTLDCGPMVGDYLITPTFVITKNYSFKTPIIYKDKLNMESYMDISPSEIATQQSHIQSATGKVYLAGLGLAYALYCIAIKKDVTIVEVHEFDDAVIEYYHTTIEPHISKEIRDKITIVQGDILESELPIDDFDYLYFDIWSGMNDPIMFRVLDRLKNVPIHKWECWMQDHLYFHVILDYVTNKYFDKSGELSDARSAKLLPYLSEFSGTEQILEEYKGNTKRFLYTLQKDF